jgi:hypothetical protein
MHSHGFIAWIPARSRIPQTQCLRALNCIKIFALDVVAARFLMN